MKNMHTSGVYFAVFVAIFAGALADDDGPLNLCAKVPESVMPPGGFRPWEVPAKDDLDQFMINKTGCEYVPLKVFEVHRYTRKFNGTPLDLNFAVRGFEVKVEVLWSQPFDVTRYFILGPQGLTQFDFLTNQGGFTLKEEQSTPNIIGEIFYTPFYIRLETGQSRCNNGKS